MVTTTTNAIDEAHIRQLVDDWVNALRRKEINSILAAYTPDILLFDLAPPLQYAGTDAYRTNLEEWFASFQGSVGYEIRDMSVTAGDDVAFSHSLNRISGTRTDGEKTDVWVRATVGYRKIDGRWMITHEHFSTPFEMTPPFKASLNLKP